MMKVNFRNLMNVLDETTMKLSYLFRSSSIDCLKSRRRTRLISLRHSDFHSTFCEMWVDSRFYENEYSKDIFSLNTWFLIISTDAFFIFLIAEHRLELHIVRR